MNKQSERVVRSVEWLHTRLGAWPERVALPDVKRTYRVRLRESLDFLLDVPVTRVAKSREVDVIAQVDPSHPLECRYWLDNGDSATFHLLHACMPSDVHVLPGDCVPGLVVLYEATPLAPRFPAAVSRAPHRDEVTLTGLPPSYRTHVGRVPAAPISRLRKAPTEYLRGGHWALPGVSDDLPRGVIYYSLAPLDAGWRYITRTTDGKAESYDAARAMVQNVCAGETVH